MIILKTELNKEDYEYISTQIKILIQQRDLRNKPLKPLDKVQEKNYDKLKPCKCIARGFHQLQHLTAELSAIFIKLNTKA